MIVKNEEAVLARCLESAHPWVDEIIIVDTGSTDKTVEIATRFGAKISTFKWCDDFSAARNFSIEQATGDWILWLDADDVLPEETGHRLRNLITYAKPEVGCIRMYYETRGARDASHIDRTSLFRNDPSIRFEGKVHEQLQLADFQSLQTNLEIHHLPDEENLDASQRKDRFYCTILEGEEAENPTKHEVVYHLGITYDALYDREKAIETLEKFLALPNKREHVMRAADATARLITLYTLTNKQKKAVTRIESAREHFPDHPHILLRSGEYYLWTGDAERAKDIFSGLVGTKYEEPPDLCPVMILAFWRFQRLAEAYLALGQLEDAKQLFETIYERHQDSLVSLDGLSKTYAALGDTKKAKEFAKKHASLLPKDEPIEVIEGYSIIPFGSRAPAA